MLTHVSGQPKYEGIMDEKWLHQSLQYKTPAEYAIA